METGTRVEKTFKSADTEEWWDVHFTRPLGYWWAVLFMKLSVTPNVVTIMAMIIGAIGGILFAFDDLTVNLIGMALVVLANLFDSADGQLARMTNQCSRFGRILDGFCGDVWFFFIYAALCWRLQEAGWSPFIVWPFAAIVGVYHALQSSTSDYYRNTHLYMLKGESGSELDNSEKLTEQYKKLTLKENFWNKWALYHYIDFTKRQEGNTRHLQQLFRLIRTKFGGTPPESLKEEFLTGSRPLMKWTNILTFNTRTAFLFFSLIIDLPWLYFMFEMTVLNLLWFYMNWSHESLSKRLVAKYA